MNEKIISRKIEIPESLPLLPLRDIVVFPYAIIPLAVGRGKSIQALEEAMKTNKLVLISVQKHIAIENPKLEDIYRVGTVSEILQLLKMPDGTLKVLIEGISRAEIENFDFIKEKGYVNIKIRKLELEQKKGYDN